MDRLLSFSPRCTLPESSPFSFVVMDIEVDPRSRSGAGRGKRAPCEVYLWGRCEPGRFTAQLIVSGYQPRFFVLVGEEGDADEDIQSTVDRIEDIMRESYASPESVSTMTKSRTDGYRRHKGIFMECLFPNKLVRFLASRALGDRYPVLEMETEEEIQFLSRCGFMAQGWIRVGNWQHDRNRDGGKKRVALCATVRLNHLLALPNETSIGPIVVMAFDLETNSTTPPLKLGGEGKKKDVIKLPSAPRGQSACVRRAAMRPIEPRRELERDEIRPMPKATNDGDEIIAISLTVWTHGASDAEALRHVLTQKVPATPDASCPFTVEGCASERALLHRFLQWVLEIDPDIFMTYNGNNFDVGYLITRAMKVGVGAEFFSSMARAFSATPRIKSMPTAQGVREWHLLEHSGRAHCDMADLVQRLHGKNLRSYKLDNVAKVVLQETDGKVVLPIHVMFRKYEEGTPEGILDMCRYADMDAFLLKRIADKLSTLTSIVELCRVSGIPMRLKLSAGQQVMTCSQLYTYMHRFGSIMMQQPKTAGATSAENFADAVVREGNRNKRKKDTSFKGGCVINPIPGFYEEFVLVLDFAALYPSIIQAFGLDFGSLIVDPSELDPDNDVLVVIPGRPAATFLEAPQLRTALRSDPVFTPIIDIRKARDLPSVLPPMEKEIWFRWGLVDASLPATLRDTVATRKRVQHEGDALPKGDPNKAVLNARQQALKVLSNSHYGALGVHEGKLKCTAVAKGIPILGAWMLKTICNAAEAYWPVRVIYGDTDSIMFTIVFEGEAANLSLPADLPKALDYAFALGKRMSASISGLFPNPIKLEMEKIYYPFTVDDKKKRYAGRIYSLPWFEMAPELRWDPPVDCKGLENKRRDNCEFFLDVANVMFNSVMLHFDRVTAIEVVRKACEDALEGTVPLSKLVISQSLSKAEYGAGAGKRPPAHAIVALRRAKVDPGAALQSGMRVEYIICESEGGGAGAGDVLGDRCFMLDEVIARGLVPDMHYYVENKLLTPITKMARMLELGEEPNRIIVATALKLQQKRQGVTTLDRFFQGRGAATTATTTTTKDVPSSAVNTMKGEKGKGEEEGKGKGEEEEKIKKKLKPTPLRPNTLAAFFKRA